MTGFCGWVQLGQTTGAPQGDLQTMRRYLPPRYKSDEELHEARFAIACQSDGAGALCRQDQVIVVVDGRPLVNLERVSAKDIAKLYRQRPESLFDAIGGEYAIVVIDMERERVLMAVDHLGVRPLAWSVKDSLLVFGSTATSVQKHIAIASGIDKQSIYNYVYFNMIPSPRTIFSNISKLPPAHQLDITADKQTLSRYWRPDYTRGSRADVSDQLLPVMRRAVARSSERESTGAFLSGGLDSSTVSGLLQQSRDHKADVFTIGFKQAGYDELDYSRLASKHFGLNLHEYYITSEDVLSAIPEVAANYDEPFGNSSAVPALVCARLAKSHGIDALLGGDGGDELFGGNERYAAQKVFQYYNYMPAVIDRLIMRPVFFRDAVKKRSSGFQHKVRRYIEQATMPMPDRTQNYNLLHLMGAETLFQSDFLQHVNVEEPIEQLRAQYWTDGPPDMLERQLLLDYKFTLADNDLRKVNRMCELAGIDVRYPFLDDEVVELSHRIPSKLKIKGKRLRNYFKNETDSFLPREIIEKSKHGFGLPFGEWLKLDKELSIHVSTNIAQLKNRGVFNAEFIDDLLDKHENQHAAYYGNLVWVLAMLEEWLVQHDIAI